MSVAGFIVLVAQAAAQSGTPLHLKQQGSASLLELGFKSMLIAVLCLGILAACLYGWRVWKRGQIAAPGIGPGAQLETARRISPKTLLLTVQWQGRRYLLAENGGHTSVIDSREIEATEK